MNALSWVRAYYPRNFETLMDRFGGADALLSDICMLTMCLVGVAGCFQYSELAQLKESDVVIYPEHMELFVEASKTDQFRDGAWVVIARTQFKLCPVAMMERYTNMAAIETHGD